MFNKLFVLYFSQIYKAVLPLFFVPLIIHELGVEQYGMVSFFSMLMGWVGLLDAGISGTFIKLVATNKNNFQQFNKVCKLFFQVSLLFFLMAFILSWLVWFNSGYISTQWLNTDIGADISKSCVSMIGFILAIIYLKTYLASFLNGMEKQHFVAGWFIVSSSILYGLSYWVVKNMDDKLLLYFYTLVIVSIGDLVVIVLMLLFFIYRNKLSISKHTMLSIINEDEFRLSSIFKFSLQLSGLSIIWVVATQIDKLVLSTYSTLSSYAHYQIATQLGAILAVFSTPLSQFLLPRLSALYKEKKNTEFTFIFIICFVLFIVVLGPIVPYFFFFGEKLISLWMHSQELGLKINEYAEWIVSASFISASMNFVFIFLYAQGKLKEHFYAYAVYSMLTIPLSIIVAKYYGANMSSKFVFFHSLIFMFIWGGVCVKAYMKNFNMLFLVSVTPVFLISTICFFVLSKLILIYGLKFSFYLALFFPIVNVFFLLLFYYFFREQLRNIFKKVSIRGCEL